MSRKVPLGEDETCRVASAHVLLRGGVDERTGEVLSGRLLAERVGWCADLVAGMTATLLERHWNGADVNLLTCGRDHAGRRLPSNAWMALRRLGWGVSVPGGVKVNDRIVRMAQEQAGRILRSAQWRAYLTAGVLATWPADPRRRTSAEWDQVREAIPDGARQPGSVIKARTRQILAFAQTSGRLPIDVSELEGVPRAPRILILAACDRQQAILERREDDPGRVMLRLQLPIRPDPRSYRDWTWVACPIALAPTIPPQAVLHLPTLRPNGHKVSADMAFSHAVPAPRRDEHTVALGVDWGLNTLLCAGAVRRCADGRITALGSGAMFRAGGVQAKGHRLRRQAERLHTKSDRFKQLLAPDDHRGRSGGGLRLAAKQTVLTRESEFVAERRSNLNDALARSAARWAVDQAVTSGATVIYLEDLRSMEAKGMGRTLNTRLSQQVRGRIVERMRHLAGEVGIAVVLVPAKNTSRHCPQCLVPLRHCKAPDRPATPGWKWAICPAPACGWQGDRDQAAWRRIAARGLTHQPKTIIDRASGTMTIRRVVDELETAAVVTPAAHQPSKTRRADRSKTGPTRRRTNSPRPVPRRREAPSPTGRKRSAGKRPEGHAHTDQPRLPRAARRRYQGVITISASTPTTARRPHRARGAALGAGFHLHAHTTPPRWEHILATETPSEPRIA